MDKVKAAGSFKVRPSKRDEPDQAAACFVNKDLFIDVTGSLTGGRLCAVQADARTQEALLHPWPDGALKKDVVMTSKSLQDALDLKLGDIVRISVVPLEVEDAHTIRLVELGGPPSRIGEQNRHHWEYFLAWQLCQWPCSWH